MPFIEETVSINTSGSAGAATGSGTTNTINGEIVSIHTAYHASAPDTTDVTFTESGGATRTILALSNGNTSVTKNVRVATHDATGTAITDGYDRVCVAGRKINIAIAQSDALTAAVVVTFIIRVER